MVAPKSKSRMHDPEQKKIVLVWLFNLFPYIGLGTFYACGPRWLPFMFIFWIWEVIFAKSMNWTGTYFVLSLIGTIAIIVQRANALSARETDMYVDRTLQKFMDMEPERNSSLDLLNSESITDTLNRQLKERRRSGEEPFALDSFEAKARRAEASLRSQAADDQSTQSHQDGERIKLPEAQPAPPVVQAKIVRKPPVAARPPVEAADPTSDAATQFKVLDPADTNAAIENLSENIVAPGALVDNAPVPVPGFDYGKIGMINNGLDEKLQAPLVSANSGVTDSSQEFSDAKSSGLVKASDVGPVGPPDYAPAKESQTFSDTQAAPVSTNGAGCQPAGVQSSGSASPSNSFSDFHEFSLPDFDLPKFDYTFHADTPSVAAAHDEKCPQCGSVKDSHFSFCLKCGHSFSTSTPAA
ncbi:MAG TPA: hypothetical protein V6C72_02665 [Chroococcales cyanobacterium]